MLAHAHIKRVVYNMRSYIIPYAFLLWNYTEIVSMNSRECVCETAAESETKSNPRTLTKRSYVSQTIGCRCRYYTHQAMSWRDHTIIVLFTLLQNEVHGNSVSHLI